jgi:integrase
MKEELLEKYKQALSKTRPGPYIARAAAFLRWLGDRDFNEANVLKWLEHLRTMEDGYADGTIAHDFTIVKRLAKVNGITLVFRSSDTPQVHETSVYIPLLDGYDIQSMVSCVRGMHAPFNDVEVRPEHAAFLALSTVYGLRRVEMAEMKPEFLDFKARTIFVQTAKRGRQRYHLIPECIISYLEDWGFKQVLSTSHLSRLMQDLKAMIGLSEEEVGWHSIRRSAVREAYTCGLTDPEILSFYRWRRPRSSMPLSYAMGHVVSTRGSFADVSYTDRGIDEKVFNLHPFVKFWE